MTGAMRTCNDAPNAALRLPVRSLLPATGIPRAPGSASAGNSRNGRQISPLRNVITSTPSSVTSTVCSHCAESEWSFVTTVQ